MKKTNMLTVSLMVVCLAGTMIAHPHFNKTVTASVKGLELKLTYFTLPYNAKHLEGIKEGFVFHCGRAKLNVAGEMTVGKRQVGGGQLSPSRKGKVRRRVDSNPGSGSWNWRPSETGSQQSNRARYQVFLKQSELHHLDLNLTGGHGDTDGKLLVTVSFGSRRSRSSHHFACTSLRSRRIIKVYLQTRVLRGSTGIELCV